MLQSNGQQKRDLHYLHREAEHYYVFVNTAVMLLHVTNIVQAAFTQAIGVSVLILP